MFVSSANPRPLNSDNGVFARVPASRREEKTLRLLEHRSGNSIFWKYDCPVSPSGLCRLIRKQPDELFEDRGAPLLMDHNFDLTCYQIDFARPEQIYARVFRNIVCQIDIREPFSLNFNHTLGNRGCYL